MPIRTLSPRIVEQIASTEVPFTDGDTTLDSVANIYTARPVLAVAHSSGRLVAQGSQSLVFRSFNIPPEETVLGIELLLDVTRLARIQDRTVQLYYRSQAQGENRANLSAEDQQVYGGATDLWRSRNIDFASDDFGVIIDLQPHTQYPSNNLVYFRSVQLRVYTQ